MTKKCHSKHDDGQTHYACSGEPRPRYTTGWVLCSKGVTVAKNMKAARRNVSVTCDECKDAWVEWQALYPGKPPTHRRLLAHRAAKVEAQRQAQWPSHTHLVHQYQVSGLFSCGAPDTHATGYEASVDPEKVTCPECQSMTHRIRIEAEFAVARELNPKHPANHIVCAKCGHWCCVARQCAACVECDAERRSTS